MKTGLTDAETVFSLDLLNYKSERLELLRNQMNIADSHVEALFAIDLEQETVTVANQNKKRTDAEIVIEQCEDIIRTKRAVIQEKIASEGAAAERALVDTVATIVTTPVTATTTAPGRMGPKIERLPLPDFKGGQLKDYVKWK